MNIARGQRKIKAYQTGWTTFRRIIAEDGREGFVIVAYFADWHKSFCIDPHDPTPYYKGGKGRVYPSIGACWAAVKKYCPNLRGNIGDCVPEPLAKSDFYYSRIYDRPAHKPQR